MTEIVSKVTAHQLQQSIVVEKLLRLHGMQVDGGAGAEQSLVAKYDALSQVLEGEFCRGPWHWRRPHDPERTRRRPAPSSTKSSRP